MFLVKVLSATRGRSFVTTSLGDSRFLHCHSWEMSGVLCKFMQSWYIQPYSSIGYCSWESLFLQNIPKFGGILIFHIDYRLSKKVHCRGILICSSKRDPWKKANLSQQRKTSFLRTAICWWFFLTFMKSSENYLKYYHCDELNSKKYLILYVSNTFRIRISI